MALRFDGRVAIVTGAGNGLGKAYALELAKRGAKVVVNDLGGGWKGEKGDEKEGKRVADLVVDEIRNAGGEAVADYNSVENGAAIVETAVKAFKKVDIVINNAGILRDVSFKRMTNNDWDMIVKVHLNGTYAVTKAAYPIMEEQGFGRIITVSSPAGLYGNFGQANYSMAKMGMVGFAQTLAKEGKKKNVTANVIAPIAGTRMLASVMPEDMIKLLKVEYIVSLVLWLCHEKCQESGSVYECGGGSYQKVQLARANGWAADLAVKEPTVEDVASHWKEINDMEGHELATMGSQAGIANVMKLGSKL